MRPAVAVIVAGIFGLVGVAAGAFGAHGLADRVTAHDLDTWRTAAHYQQVHAVALACVGLWGNGPRLRMACALFVIGMVVFSGTLYAIVLGGPRLLGAITPIGGLSLMAGWAFVALHGFARLDDGEADSG